MLYLHMRFTSYGELPLNLKCHLLCENIFNSPELKSLQCSHCTLYNLLLQHLSDSSVIICYITALQLFIP